MEMRILTNIPQKRKTNQQRRQYSAMPRLILLMLCVGVLLLGACRKSPKALEQTAAEGNLSIQLNYLGVDLRSGDDDPISAIEKLDLYFFSSEPEAEKRTVVAHRVFSKDELTTNGPLSISLPVSSYYLVAVLNGTRVIQNTFGQGASWSKLQSVYGFDVPYTVSQNKVTSVVWSNDQGPIKIDESAFGKKSSPVQVTLTRTIARLRMFGEPKVPHYMSIDLTNGGAFTMGSRAFQIFLMRELAPLIGVAENKMEQPGDETSFASRYAYSPGYDKIASSGSDEYKALLKTYRLINESKTIFNLESRKLIPKTIEECDLTEQTYYVLETTVDPNHYSYYFLPSVLVGYKIYPISLGTLEGFKADEGWVSFNGRYYRGRDFTDYLKAIYERNKSTKNPKPTVTIPTGYPQDLQAVCEDYVKTSGDKMFVPSVAYKGELYPIDYKGLRYYLRSYNYYYLPIQHASDQEGYGRYGIVRNNDYRIEIKSISDFGSPILMQIVDHPEEYKPKAAITATLTLTPLTDRKSTTDL